MDGSIHTATAQQAAFRRIDNGINLLARDVAFDRNQSLHVNHSGRNRKYY